MSKKINRTFKWIYSFVGPVLSLIAFIITYFLDPLNFGNQQPISAIPAFLISIVILLISHNINTSYALRKSNLYSDRIYEAVKDYLHVTSLGSPQKAFQYIISRLAVLREVKNTSFNLSDQIERADEKFYDTEVYESAMSEIAKYACKNLIWKDIGDSIGVKRLRYLNELTTKLAKKNRHSYKYRLITHNEAQLNFVILEFDDGNKEVLFNWDFRGIGQDPTVLISREHKIVEMFTIHFSHLWNSASPDHDSEAVKSVAMK